VILIDAATFFLAAGALLMVRIPQPRRTTDPGASQASGETKSLLADAAYGWQYLRTRPGLLGLLLYFATVNFFLSFSGVLLAPLVLAFGTPAELGMVQMVGGTAMLAGGAIMGAWGGPRRRVPWLIAFIALASVGYLVSGIRASIPVIACGQFLTLFFIPFAAAFSQAVFQTKVPPGLQGRVFAIRAMIAYSIMPLAYLLAGPLADQVFEPLLKEGGALSQTLLGRWMGVAPGRGIGLMFIVSWLFLWVESLFALVIPRIRLVEDELPDAIPDETTGTSAGPLPPRPAEGASTEALAHMIAD
jgi:MFS family permease